MQFGKRPEIRASPEGAELGEMASKAGYVKIGSEYWSVCPNRQSRPRARVRGKSRSLHVDDNHPRALRLIADGVGNRVRTMKASFGLISDLVAGNCLAGARGGAA